MRYFIRTLLLLFFFFMLVLPVFAEEATVSSKVIVVSPSELSTSIEPVHLAAEKQIEQKRKQMQQLQDKIAQNNRLLTPFPGSPALPTYQQQLISQIETQRQLLTTLETKELAAYSASDSALLTTTAQEIANIRVGDLFVPKLYLLAHAYRLNLSLKKFQNYEARLTTAITKAERNGKDVSHVRSLLIKVSDEGKKAQETSEKIATLAALTIIAPKVEVPIYRQELRNGTNNAYEQARHLEQGLKLGKSITEEIKKLPRQNQSVPQKQSSAPTSVPQEKIHEDTTISTLRKTWKDYLTGGDSLDLSDEAVQAKVASLASLTKYYYLGNAEGKYKMNQSPERTYLWEDQQNILDKDQLSTMFYRLHTFSLAYATKGVVYKKGKETYTFTGNPELAKAIIDATSWLIDHAYQPKFLVDKKNQNWWYWQIGIPKALNDEVILLTNAPGMTQTKINQFMQSESAFQYSDPRWPNDDDTLLNNRNITGANRVWFSQVIGIRNINLRNVDGVKVAMNALSGTQSDHKSSVFAYADKDGKDGFYMDGSFIQHYDFGNKIQGYAYNGGYGQSLLVDLSALVLLYNSNPITHIADSDFDHVYAWAFNAFQPLLYKGEMMDMVRGRVISVGSFPDFVAGSYAVIGLLQLIPGVPSAYQTSFKQIVKDSLLSDQANYQVFAGNAPISVIALAHQIVKDPLILPLTFTSHKQYPRANRVVHATKDWALGLSLSSSRLEPYETLKNAENLHGWFTGDGMLYYYTQADPKHYGDNFWNTINPYYLPGTTVDLTPLKDGAVDTSNRKSVAGGATLDSKNGIAGMDLVEHTNTLTAKKSWFFLNNEMIALGTGITSTNPQSLGIITTMENRKLADGTSPQVTIMDALGIENKFMSETPETIPNVQWIHYPDTGGYVFPQAQTITGARSPHTGSFFDINKYYPRDPTTNKPYVPVTKTYQIFWFDHGKNPTNAAYSYVFLPQASLLQTQLYAKRMGTHMRVLQNDQAMQAIRLLDQDLLAANIWAAPATVGAVTTDQPVSLMMRTQANRVKLALQDPTSKQGEVNVVVKKAVNKVEQYPPAVTYRMDAQNLYLRINFAQTAFKGETQLVTFTLK